MSAEIQSAESAATSPGCDRLIDIFLPSNPKHADFVMQIQYSDRLVCLRRSEALYRAFLRRLDLGDAYRLEGLGGLVKSNGSTLVGEWVVAAERLDAEGVQLDPRDGQRQVTDSEWDSILKQYLEIFVGLDRQSIEKPHIRESLEVLALGGNREGVRRLAFAAMVHLDGKIDEVWNLASRLDGSRADIFEAGRWLGSAKAKSALFMKGQENPSTDESVNLAYLRFLAAVPGHDEEIFQLLTAAIETPYQMEAVRGLLAKNIDNMSRDLINRLVDQLASIYGELPPRMRTKAKGKEIATLLSRLGDYIPEEKRSVLQARLNGLEVMEVNITAMKEQMDFDKRVLLLQAGQPVEITFHNGDTMPHNLVLVRSGAMETVGVAADQLAVQQGEGERKYVPETADVLHHTKMVESGESVSLAFRAPTEEGVYPLLCTFPGHWLKMFAAVVVARDPQAYLASQETPLSRDALLGVKNYEHHFDELAEKLKGFDEARSFDRGRAAFYSRACVSCHMVGGKGGRVGPELSNLSGNQKPSDILRSIMYPSEKIDPKYAKAEVEHLESGKIYAGVLVPQDDPETVYLIEDPLAECEPQVFQRNEVEIVALKVSPMPEALLRRSSPAEVLDLVAYLVSGGNPEHPIFSKGKSDKE